MNKVILSGKIEKDFELKSTPSGLSVVSFQMKCFNDDNKKSCVYVNCVLWRENADQLASKAKKGTEIILEGRLNLKTTETKDGKKNYSMEVVGEKFEIISSSGTSYNTSNNNNNYNYNANYQSNELDFDDDDVPF